MPNGPSKANVRLPVINYVESDLDRRFSHGASEEDERSDFEDDRSRIIHSSAFRRLQGKTQLFAPDQSDFFRTRLTHSLEVAQIAKGLALRLGADHDLCEAGALVHDIGHPPFGHRGEVVLRNLMNEFGGFEANAQNLRVVGHLEEKYPDCEGLDLCRAVLDAGFKYKTSFSQDLPKHFYYEGDPYAAWVIEVGGTEQSFECQIVDLADDVAYAAHDFEDGLKAGLITERRADLLFDEILAEAKGINDSITTEHVGWAFNQILDVSLAAPGISGDIAAKAKTSDLIGGFIRGANRIERRSTRDWGTERYKYAVDLDQTTRLEIDALRGLTFRLLISDQRVSTLESRAETILSALFKHFVAESALNAYPDRHRLAFQRAKEIGEKERARVACDYISGMTDEYAQRLYRRLFTAERSALHDF